MKELILTILIACSLSLTGCTEEQQSTGNKQLDDALGIKTEEKKDKEPKKTESNKKEEVKESDTGEIDKIEEKKADNNSKKSDEGEPDPQSDEEIIKRVNARDIVIGQCIECNRTIRKSEIGIDRDYILCKDCYNKGYTKCLNCGKSINGYDEDVSNGSSGSLCKECTEEYIYNSDNVNTKNYCSKCGKELDIDSSSSCTYDDNGNLLCLDCYFEDNDQVGDMPE